MDDNEDELEENSVFFQLFSPILGAVILALVFGLIAGLSLASTAMEKYPQDYTAFIVANLGASKNVSVSNNYAHWVEKPNGSFVEVESPLAAFYVTYWNGSSVLFDVPDEVWSAAVAASQKYEECDPRFIVALAHSESAIFQNDVCSSAGACGTWQFMPATWADMWQGAEVMPERTDRYAAAEAACRYTQINGMIGALGKSESAFIYEFASDPPVWNAYPPQAEYVWRLYHQILAGGEDTTSSPDEEPKADKETASPGNSKVSSYCTAFTESKEIHKQAIIILLKTFNLWPKLSNVCPGKSTAGTNIPPAEGDELLAIPVGVLTWGLHGQSYGDCAIDVSGGKNAPVASPINGEVTQKFTDGLGNPTIRIENAFFIVDLLHGNWEVEIGDKLTIGDLIGTESNQGNTGWVDENNVFHYCGTGSDCGYHVHFDVSRRGQGCTDPQLLINWPPKE